MRKVFGTILALSLLSTCLPESLTTKVSNGPRVYDGGDESKVLSRRRTMEQTTTKSPQTADKVDLRQLYKWFYQYTSKA
jgi:hypothetical protein